ncbi:deoxyribose-phosphate aldolase [Streptomyces sp. NPDC087856]|uniref:Cgl0159 family (beta/alpha)8-fold protein n=1 Tax=Streptomyces sp. NPDC087856 TaxID=3365811 RepID=UPI00382523A7
MRAGRVTGAEHEGQYEGGDGVTHAHGEQGDGDDVSGHEGSTTGNRPSTGTGSSTATGARTSASTGTGARTPTSTGTTPSTGPRVDISELVRTRTRHPEAIAEAAARRVRRPLLNDAGRLMIVAADHPARGALGVGDRKFAMANRAELLERLCLALSRPGVDGVLATADILDDLLLLGALDGKVVMGSMNRGGLQGASFELDDRFTGHRAQDIERLRFDAGKLLLRIDYDDPGSLTTLESTARAIDDMAARQLPLFVEPFISRRTDEGKLRNDLSAEAVIKSIAISSGLGGTSAYTWLKLPVTENPDDMAQVMETSTLPAVLLGGEVGDDQDGAYEKWRGALQLPTVRGLVVGRSLLYPPDGDVAAAVDTAVGLL